MHRGLRDVDQLGDLRDPEPGRTGGEREQDLRGAFNGTCHGYPFSSTDPGSAQWNGRPIMLGIVLISHSSGLAAGPAELAGQIAGGSRVVPAGGTEDGQLGTSTRLTLSG